MNGRLRSVKPEENLDLQSEATIAPRVHVEDLKSGNEIHLPMFCSSAGANTRTV